MSRQYFGWVLAAGGLMACCASGCSRYPAAPEGPEISPGKAGRAAIAQYDADGNDRLDATEIAKCPALKHAMKEAKDKIDINGDGMLTADEITARIEYWSGCGTIVMSGNTLITLNGKRLPGATVTFEPEEFLGSGFTTCEGVTDDVGMAFIKGPDPQFPGLYLGFYRVKVSKVVGGRETIPSDYNTNTELGFEASDDHQGIGNIEFHLRSR